MATQPKRLRIVGAALAGPETRVLELECVEGGAFDVVGGRYIIVHTGLMQGERPVKRAYSLMPAGTGLGRAAIAVKRLGGPGSSALHDVALGTELGFSGPWGKLVPEGGLAERTLLVATDTGISAALGIVEEPALRAGPCVREVLWLRQAGETFLDLAAVRARVARAGSELRTETIAGPEAPARLAQAWELVEARATALGVTHVVATGDGGVVHPLRARLPERVPAVGDVRIECFFRNPEKKSV